MKLPHKLILAGILFAAPCHAAVSILVQPGSDSEHSVFTVTQTSPSPIVYRPSLVFVGYAIGMALPTSMFNIPDFSPGFSSDIHGTLLFPLARVVETYTGQFFALNDLRISVNPSMDSTLGFDRMFSFPSGADAFRFEVESAGPVELNIPHEMLHPGIHATNDAIFGDITVTVVPEPSAAVASLIGGCVLLMRRRPERQRI